MKKWYLIWLFYGFATTLLGQIPNIDHTRNYDRHYKDSLKVVAKKLLKSTHNSAHQVAQEMQVLNLLGSLYLEDDYRDLDTSMTYNDQLYDLAKQTNTKEMMVAALLRREIKYRRAHDYVKSLELSLEALKLCQQGGGNCEEAWRIQQNLGQSFLRASDFSNAEKYLLDAQRQLDAQNFNDAPLKQKYNLGLYSLLTAVYTEWGKPEKAMIIFERQLEVAKSLKNKHSLAGTLEEMGDFYNKISQPQKAIGYLSQALMLFQEAQHTRGIASVNNSFGESYLALKNYNKALEYAQNALRIANQNNYQTLKPYAYQTVAAAQENLGNELASLRAYKMAANLRDSLGFARRVVALADMQRVYEVDKARFEQQIAIQDRNRNFLWIVVGLLSVFGGALGLYSRTLRQKNNELARKKREIEEAYLKGQATERKRVASELHDNLGGLLSAAKLSLQVLDPSQLDRNEREIYDNVVEMMIDACRQVRTLSHNMLPEDLEKEGLLLALERLSLKLNTAGTTRFHLQISDNFPKRLSAEYEFNLYLIGFELCNNILKHAQATEAHIQLLNKDEQIQLIVEDNGCGLREEQHNEGMGLKNVKQRAADLGGEVEINHKSSGTIVTVKIRNTKPTKKPQTASVSKIR